MQQYKTGICAWQLPVEGPASFALAAELGYNGVDILDQGGAGQNYTLNNPRVQDIYKRCAQSAGIEIRTLQLRALAMSGKVKCHPDSAGGKDALDAIRKGAEACRAMGIKRLMVENFFDSVI